MRDLITLIETNSAPDLKEQLKALQDAVDEAQEAFAKQRDRANLQAVWDAQRARDEFQQQHWPNPPEPPPAEKKNDYEGEHQAPDHENGSPLYDLCLNGIYPQDFYTGRSCDFARDEPGPGALYAISTIMGCHRRPNRQVKVYRAVPHDAPRRINVGDWVSIVRSYAVQHGRENLKNKYHIVSKTVCARDVWNEGNSLLEWGYDPQPRVARVLKPRSPASD